ncbi:MAG: Nuclear actin-protein involved in chromatin remodeling [Peltula sp. TS41687]|nr:MAG: Nuclear actin-protein involved in chromatin remodeling [Peltula sp. TS41687]
MTQPMEGIEPTNNGARSDAPQPPAPPARIWNIPEPIYPRLGHAIPGGYEESHPAQTAIVIDNGCSTVRAGWSFDASPRLTLPPVLSRYRDRKVSKTYSFVGADAHIDATARGQIRSAFEAGSAVVSNWDVMESVLDYIFLKLGVDGAEADGGVGRHVVLTEPVANLAYSRKTMTEILFECYSAPSVAYGIDSLFSYDHNNGRTGLVVSSSHSSTHLIPVVDQKPMLNLATRLNWGGQHNADFLLKLLQLKYPNFPGKITAGQAEELVREHCYVSLDYEAELSRYLDWTGLEDRDHTIQYPFTEQVVVQKTAEELARIAEKRKESGRRLQEQAAKTRLEKLIKKEQELEYYRDLQQKGAAGNKKDFKRLLDANDFETEAQLEKVIKDLDKAIRRARTKDVGGGAAEDEEEEQPSFPLLDVPDDELDEAGIKQKRQQRLAKANVEARARAKAEKEREKARVAEERRMDEERRENNLDEWVKERRVTREKLLQRLKDRQRLKADLGNRKSLASQLRMKSIASLASDTPGNSGSSGNKKRRRGGDDDDKFGANDDDWGVYRTIAVGGADGSDEENAEEEEMTATLQALESDLLAYDASFEAHHTFGAQADWTKSLIHAFLRGPAPFDPDSARHAHQLHLNVERVRVPEVVFQPFAIAGLDQAGVVEIVADILTQRLGRVRGGGGGGVGGGGGGVGGGAGVARDVLRDVFLTGGNTLFRSFDERLRGELVAVLPAGAPLGVRRAKDPLLDAWRGAAGWVARGAGAGAGGDWERARVTREEYAEKGAEWFKEHRLGNCGSGAGL